MLTLILTTLFNFIINAVLLGFAMACLIRRYRWRLNFKQTIMILLMVLVLLDMYWVPAFSALDITFTIRNAAIADALGYPPNLPLSDLFNDWTWWGILGYVLQSVLAAVIAVNFSKEKETGPISTE